MQHPLETAFQLKIAKRRPVADGIVSFELVHPEGQALPPFTVGSHLTIQVPNGEQRKYSLCNSPDDAQHYQITVKREDAGRGGSRSLVDEAQEGDLLHAWAPDNAFELVDNAKSYLFIAGGIGITPMLSMIRSFGELPPAPWKLVYLSQRPESTAFLDELGDPAFGKQVRIHHDFGDPAKQFDLWPLLEKPDQGHVYCCGPRGLMEAVRDMTGHWSPSRIHFESFVEGGAAQPNDKPFDVHLAQSGQTLTIPVGQSILSVLRESGHAVPSSCESGSCGSCKTRLLEGQADHRDFVLMPDEMDDHIMVCVSRAQSDTLTLDL